MRINIKHSKDDPASIIAGLIIGQGCDLCDSEVGIQEYIKYFSWTERKIGVLYMDPNDSRGWIDNFISIHKRWIGIVDYFSKEKILISVFGVKYEKIMLTVAELIQKKFPEKQIELIVKDENRREVFSFSNCIF